MTTSSSYLFIVNPHSNSGKTFKKWKQIFLPKIQKSIPNCGWSFTNSREEGAYIAQYAQKLNYDIVVAVGGDGTINEVVNGLLNNPLPPNQAQFTNSPTIEGYLPTPTSVSSQMPALGFLPTGTGCDFIKSIHIPHNFDDAFKILLQNKRHVCNVGKMQFTTHPQKPLAHFRYFINVASVGITGIVVKEINQNKKFFGGKFSFWKASVAAILKNRSNQALVYFDEESAKKLNLQALFICNGIYCGGGMKIAKEASIGDGIFHINEIQKINRIKSIFLTGKLYSGDFSGCESFVYQRTAKKIRVEPNQNSDILVECDGEQPGILPALFSLAEKNLEIIC